MDAEEAHRRYLERVRQTVEESGSIRRASIFLRMPEEEIRALLDSPD